MTKVSVAQLNKLTRLEIFVWSVSRHCFVNLFMHSPERYLNGQMAVTSRPKHLKRDQSLHFTPLSETMSIPITFIWESLKLKGNLFFEL